MKTITKLVLIFTLLTGFGGHAQITPEQQKEIEAAQKKAMEDAMNHPAMKDAMEKMAKMRAQQEKEGVADGKAAEKEAAESSAKHLEEFYWRNKIASNTSEKFANWKWGAVDIGFYDGDDRRPNPDGTLKDSKYVIVGSINGTGLVTLNFPANLSDINHIHPIDKSLIPEMGDMGNSDVTFSKPETSFRRAGFALFVLKGTKELGILYTGNSERTTENLASPAFNNYGDEGYLLYWVYVREACSAKAIKKRKYQYYLAKDVEEQDLKQVDQTIVYDLNFKPGWNMIKSEVIGNYEINGRARFKTKKSTVVSSMPGDARYYFEYANN